jgi:hypothetical protein
LSRKVRLLETSADMTGMADLRFSASY